MFGLFGPIRSEQDKQTNKQKQKRNKQKKKKEKVVQQQI